MKPLECNEAFSVFIAEAPLLERFGSVVRLHSSFLVDEGDTNSVL